MKRNVLIAGGGIAGMASALTLSRAGWQVQVFERAKSFVEVGAGVQLGPNVTRVLQAWGLSDALKQVAAFPTQLMARSARSSEILGALPLAANMQTRYGAPYITIHRADLHQLLLDEALAQGTQVEADSVVQSLHSDLAAQDAQPPVNAQVLMAGQTVALSADMAVVADGVWSQLRQQLLADGSVQPTGHLAYRTLLRQADLPAHLRSNDVTVWMGPDAHVVHYPVCGGEWLNLVVLTEGQMLGVKADDLQSWNAQQTPEQTEHDLQAALRGACVRLQEIISAATSWRAWPLCGRAPMRGAHQHAIGRVALVGDAAHPMLPYLAQGAGMAIEDAAVLAQQLILASEQSSGHAVADGIQVFAAQRWQRNAQVQRGAVRNGQVFHARGPMRWGRDVGLRLAGPMLMDQPWLYGYKI
jgi:salicylate hydroxylase